MPFLTVIRRAFCLVLLSCAAFQARAAGPAFLVSVSNATTHLSELMEVTTAPFAASIVAETNGVGVYTNSAPWSALAFSSAGTLYATTLGGGLAAVDPANAASSVLATLHLASGASVPATGLAFSIGGEAYLLDGGTNLYMANLGTGLCAPAGGLSQIGSGGPPLVLATAPNGAIFGLFLSLYKINLNNAKLTEIGSSFPFSNGANIIYAKGAAFGSDGKLYMVGWDSTVTHHPTLYLVNTTNGLITALGRLPPGSSGLVALGVGNSDGPVVVLPPASQTAMAGATVSFSVTGGGAPAPQAQWFFGNDEFSGATNFTLTITNISPTNAGNYFVVLTNSNGAATSAVVTLTVTAPILASTGSNIFLGAATNLILGLTTNPPTQSVLLSSNLFYSRLCFDPQGDLFAAGEYFAPSTNPPIATITGVAALFRINALMGTTNFTANFQLNGNTVPAPPGGLAFSPSGILYAAYKGSLYTVSTNSGLMALAGAFPAGTAVQGIAFAPNGTLYGGETNLYKINLTNASVAKIAALNGVSASILGDMKYAADGFLYFFDGGADGNLYRLDPADAQVSVAANYPSVLSGLAFLPTPTVIETEPANQIVQAGATAIFSVTATGASPLQYQWYFNHAAIPKATNLVLTIPNARSITNGNYFVIVSNSLGPVTSSVVTLAAYTLPVITQPPSAQIIITPGQTISLGFKATGSALSYQWQWDGTNLPGAAAAALTIPKAGANNAGTYTINVSTPYLAQPATASSLVEVIPFAPTLSSPANGSTLTIINLTVTGREPANGGAAAILYQLNHGAVQSAAIAPGGLTWSAPVVFAPGTNTFLVWAVNASGSSAAVQAEYNFQPFNALGGVYHGLFYDTANPAFTNAGYFNLTLATNRVFSGSLLLDGGMSSFSGQFDPNGNADVLAGAAPGPLFNLSMQMDFTGADTVSGSVSNFAQSWNGSLTAYRAAFSAAAPATNFEGNYTVAINGAYDPALAPPGYSYGMATVTSAGGVSILHGTMSDGSPFAATGALSKNGIWPLYTLIDSGKGSVLAWVKFPKHAATLQASAGEVLWIETPGASSYYPNGFTLFTNQLDLLVNPYAAPPKGHPVLPSVNYMIDLFGGNLPGLLAIPATINSADVVTPSVNTNSLHVAINSTNGSFTGSFVNPITGATTSVQGIILLGSNAAYGWFLGANQTGGILIQP